MGIAEHEYGAFRDAVRALAKTGRVVLGSKNAIMLPDQAGRVVGVFRGNPRGFGFIVPDTPSTHGDLYVPEGRALDAITGDRVIARVSKAGKRDGRRIFKGEIIEVLQRGQNRFVGELLHEDSRWFVLPDGNTLHVPIFVRDVGAKNAQRGDQVVAEIIQYPAPGIEAKGVIVETLGRRGDPGVDTLAICRQYQFSDTFSEAALEDARQVTARFDPEADDSREELTGETIITIDPDDARDFDDAFSIRQLDDGLIELGVHIADVASFVKAGSALDEEARERGNSVYLPRHVVPMLPEVLSNGLCSLQENEPRFTKSVFLRYDNKGKIKGTRFANGLIRSAKRLTYGEATQIISGKNRGYDKKIVALVREAEALARTLHARRLRTGQIVLELPEVELVFDDDGKVIDVEPADTSFSHTLIEMFMVEANEAAARLLHRQGVPCLRRVHPDPDADALTNAARFVRVLGHEVPARLGRKDMQRLLKNVKGRPESFAVNLAVLRSMQRAEYAPRNVGHFALASKHYCHFTSPIRRYPDLTVHRLLDLHIRGELEAAKHGDEVPTFDALQKLGGHCSFTEQRATSAERELRKIKVLQHLEGRIGDVVPGIVTGVANAGVFVQIEKYLIDGLVRLKDLPDDWWDVDTKAGSLVGERTGRRITIGDVVRVRLEAINLAARELDLILVETTQPQKGTPKKKHGKKQSPSAKRKQATRPPKRDKKRQGQDKKRTKR
jgi:ribonuclease R